jgi:uncharacterized protein (TIGR00269 family)
MKCHKCGGVAVIGMPQHRLNLCAEHFDEWLLRMVQRTIDKYAMFAPDERVLVAVSGGKDSLGLWDILIRLGHQTEGVYIHLGIDHEGYSDVSQSKVAAFAAERDGLSFRVVNVRETYGRGIPDLKHTGRGQRVCSVCGLIKRHIMNRIAYEGGYAAIATGHNLDDEAAILMQNALRWQVGYLERQAPVLPSTHPRLARKVKPLCEIYERESAAYALLREIDFVEEECPFSVDAKTIFYKEILNQLERRSPGTKRQFYADFLRGKAAGGIVFHPRDAADEPSPEAYGTCRECGQPTYAGDLCAFCRLIGSFA